ncbi:MAG: DUF1292 domain-containing protein [Eubacteriales bacterium]|nr:DUF1292 domain-containing protein [Eubacteriales bacterium]
MEEDRIIELVDENGDTERFVYMMTMDKNEKRYAILEPEELGDDEESEVVILEIVEDGEDDFDLVPVEDEVLLEDIFNEYVEAINAEDDEYEEGDEEEEEDEEEDEEDE